MGRPVRHSPEEWKAIEKEKAFWGNVKGATASIVIIVIVAVLIFKIGAAVIGIQHPSAFSLLVVFVVGAVVLIAGMTFR